MRVLVTGGAGFLGSHICEHYRKKNWEVIAYDNLTKYELLRTGYDTTGAREYSLKRLKELGVKVVVADVRDGETLRLASTRCDYIIHTAAQPAMTIAIESPALDFSTNVAGTVNVLEAVKLHDIPVVNCSTIHVYGDGINDEVAEGGDRFYCRNPLPPFSQEINESHPLLTGSPTPLHASKRAAEIYTRAYATTYGLRAANFRFTGMYGPGQFGGEDHGWVANFAIRTILGLPIKIFGTDKQVRDILYVKDAVKAFDAWHQNGCISGTFNIGGGEANITSLGSCLSALYGITGTEQDISVLPARKGDLYYFCCDNSLATETFGWTPETLPADGIRYLINWIQENIEIFRGDAK